MSHELDERYLTWLYGQVGSVRLKNPARTWWSLLRQLYTTEFVWLVPNDDNRVEDGRCLREEFISDQEILYVDPAWMSLGCSMLEMLIGLSRRLSFEDRGEPREWFWHLLDNLGIIVNDADYNNRRQGEVAEAIDILIWRRYAPDGRGGLFPLKQAHQDQRNVELWYQLNLYLLERD